MGLIAQGVSEPPPRSIGTNRMEYYFAGRIGADWLWKANRCSAARENQLSRKRKNPCLTLFSSFEKDRTARPDGHYYSLS